MPDRGAALQTLLNQSNLEFMRLCCSAYRYSAPIAQTASGQLPRAVGRDRRALPPVRSASDVARAVTRRCPARVGLRFANLSCPLDLSAYRDIAPISQAASGILPSRKISQTPSGTSTLAEIRQTASDQSGTQTLSWSHRLYYGCHGFLEDLGYA